MSDKDPGQKHVAELVAGVTLDASGLETGAAKAGRAYVRMQETFSQQKAKLEQTGSQIDKLGAKIDNLQAKYNSFSIEKRFSAEGGKVQAEIDQLIEQSDKLVVQYGKEEDALNKMSEKLTEMGHRVNEVAQKEEAAAAKRQANQTYAQTSLQVTALSASLRILGSQFGEAGDFISAIIQYLVVYRQQTLLAKNAADAQAAAEATKNAQMTMGLSILIMVIAKVIEYAQSADRATSKIEEMREELDQTVESIDASRAASEAEIKVLDPLIERYDELNNRTSLTEREKKELSSVVGQLQQAYGDLDWQLDKTTGKWKVQTGEIYKNREAMLANIKAQAMYSRAAKEYEHQLELFETYGVTEDVAEDMVDFVKELGLSKDGIYTFDLNGLYTNFFAEKFGKHFDGPLDAVIFYNEYAATLKAIKSWEASLKNDEDLAEAADPGDDDDVKEAAKNAAKAAKKAAEDTQKAAEDAEKRAKEKAERAEDAQKAAVKNFEDLTDAVVDALKSKYQEMRDAEEQTLQDSMDAWQQWADNNTAAIQEEIDKLDELEKKEANEQKAAELKQKADEIAYQLRFETDEYTRGELQKAYNAAKAEYDKELETQERQARKESLQEQINAVKEAAQEQQNLLQQQKEQLAVKYDGIMSNANLEQEAQKMLTGLVGGGSSSNIFGLLEQYNPEFFNFGQSLGERIASDIPHRVLTGILGSVQSYAKTALAKATGTISQVASSATSSISNNKTVTIGEINIITDPSDPNAVKKSMSEFAEYLADLLN